MHIEVLRRDPQVRWVADACALGIARDVLDVQASSPRDVDLYYAHYLALRDLERERAPRRGG